MLQVLHTLQPILQRCLVPVCFVAAWSLVLTVSWRLVSAIRYGIARTKRLHQIPCTDCQFFTGNYHLKCTVHPDSALSEQAIDCIDYEGGHWYPSHPGF